MIKFLIVDNDLKYAKKVISNIIKENEHIRLIDIITSSNIEDAISTLKKYSPHICIINSDLYDLEPILRYPYPTKIICTTDINLKSAIKGYHLKNDITPIKEIVNKYIIDSEETRVKNYVETEFYKLNFNMDSLGTKYLMECIMYSYYNSIPFVYDNLERNLYPIIAEKFGTSMHHVKWCIIQAVNHMYKVNSDEGTLRKLCDYFFFEDYNKPTAKVILATFLVKLWIQI